MKLRILKRFRFIAFWEGVSYLLLLGIAMPLKYLAGYPQAVTVVGWAHGVLFILYCAALLQASLTFKWPLKRSVLYFVASLLPIAPFIVERRLQVDQDLISEGE